MVVGKSEIIVKEWHCAICALKIKTIEFHFTEEKETEVKGKNFLGELQLNVSFPQKITVLKFSLRLRN